MHHIPYFFRPSNHSVDTFKCKILYVYIERTVFSPNIDGRQIYSWDQRFIIFLIPENRTSSGYDKHKDKGNTYQPPFEVLDIANTYTNTSLEMYGEIISLILRDGDI